MKKHHEFNKALAFTDFDRIDTDVGLLLFLQVFEELGYPLIITMQCLYNGMKIFLSPAFCLVINNVFLFSVYFFSHRLLRLSFVTVFLNYIVLCKPPHNNFHSMIP